MKRYFSRKSSTLLVVFLTLLTLVLVTANLAQAQTTNLALGKLATCSSIENVGTPCANAVDGNTGTRWSSAFSDPQWIQVDLGAPYALSSVVLRWETSYAKAFQLQLSNDTVTWTNVYSTTTGTGGVQTINFTGSGRYVRMYGTTRVNAYGYSLWEFEIYGASGATNTPTGTSTAIPGANFVGTPLSGSAPLAVQFTYVDNSPLSSCTWTFGDGATQTYDLSQSVGPCPSAAHTYTAMGSYTVSLSVVKATTGQGNSMSKPNYVQVSAPLTPTATSPVGTNLALNKPVTFSSGVQVGNEAANAVDGSTTTRWAASPWPQWIQVDLGTAYAISKTEIMPYMNRAYQYTVEVSTNGTSYTTVVNQTANTTGGVTLTDNFAAVSARYVRLTVTGASGYTGGFASLYEFRVFGAGAPPLTTTPTATWTNSPTLTKTLTPTCACFTNTPTRTLTATLTLTQANTLTRTPTATSSGGAIVLSYNAPAVASSVQDDAFCVGCTADKAFDMNNYTRWATAWADPQWIYVDLGANATITRVVLNWQNAYGKAYQIQTSPDAVTWTNIYTTTTGDGGVDDLTVSGSGRYVRLYATVRGTTYGYSLFGFDIYGTGGMPQATPTPVPTATPHGPYTNLVWSDEFNGTSLDTTNWTLETGGGGFGNNELEYYTNGQNLTFTGSEMIINARQENPAGYTCWYGACTYTSSRMKSAGKREFKYGRIEARLQIPYSQGLWPAFWMLGNNIGTAGWPGSGEIDIMENIGKEPNILHGTVHGPNYSGSNGIGGPYTLPSGQYHDAYHVYAVEWEENVMRWYMDNVLYFTLTKSTVETRGQWVFDHPFFIIMNVAVGGAWPGNPDGTTVMPQQMKVDYVRVYQ